MFKTIAWHIFLYDGIFYSTIFFKSEITYDSAPVHSFFRPSEISPRGKPTEFDDVDNKKGITWSRVGLGVGVGIDLNLPVIFLESIHEHGEKPLSS